MVTWYMTMPSPFDESETQEKALSASWSCPRPAPVFNAIPRHEKFRSAMYLRYHKLPTKEHLNQVESERSTSHTDYPIQTLSLSAGWQAAYEDESKCSSKKRCCGIDTKEANMIKEDESLVISLKMYA